MENMYFIYVFIEKLLKDIYWSTFQTSVHVFTVAVALQAHNLFISV